MKGMKKGRMMTGMIRIGDFKGLRDGLVRICCGE
jgi:hypothetical protein